MAKVAIQRQGRKYSRTAQKANRRLGPRHGERAVELELQGLIERCGRVRLQAHRYRLALPRRSRGSHSQRRAASRAQLGEAFGSLARRRATRRAPRRFAFCAVRE